MKTLVHLVRHAEVHNPNNIFYGRLEGFRLSARGLRQVEALAEYFSSHTIAAVYTSPLARAIETATPIANRHGLDINVDEDLIESESKIQGKYGDLRMFRNPFNARHFVNPLRPTWGEPYASIGARMISAIERMRDKHAAQEAVAVSHMTPVLVGRLRIEGNPRPPWRAGLPCRRASVTTLEFDESRYVATHYEPIGSSVR